ncbi:MAG: hypothetical protein ACKVPY_09600 [Paracoccaceae bacterium]
MKSTLLAIVLGFLSVGAASAAAACCVGLSCCEERMPCCDD